MKKRVFEIGFMLLGIVSICLLLATLVGVIFVDKKIENSFLNTVNYPNYIYYILGVLGTGVLSYFVNKKNISNRLFYVIAAIVVLVVAIWEANVVFWFPTVGSPGGDFQSAKDAAIGLASGLSFKDFPYFSISANNANLAIFLSFIYRVVPSWLFVEFLGALCTNLSVLFASLTVKKYTENNVCALLCLLFGEMLMAVTWRSFIVYTDNFGMLFVAVGLWIISLEINEKVKIVLYTIAIAVASYIKITCFLLFIAYIIYYSTTVFKDSVDIKKAIKKVSYMLACIILIWGSVTIAKEKLQDYYVLVKDENVKGWQYMFMVGQSTDYYGTVNIVDSELRRAYIEEYLSSEEVQKACLNTAINRIVDRGIKGNIKFYICKLDYAYGDGYFHNVQSIYSEVDKDSIFGKIYLSDGKYYAIYANIVQYLWALILVTITIACVIQLRKGPDIMGFYQILFCGITVYLMCFEGRSKYIFMFLPVYMIFYGIGMKNTCSMIDK